MSDPARNSPRQRRPHLSRLRVHWWPADAYMPRQLQRLQGLLELANEHANPPSGSTLNPGGQTTPTDRPPPGVQIAPEDRGGDLYEDHCRREHRRFLRRVDELADDLERALSGAYFRHTRQPPGRRNPRCTSCRRGARNGAVFCDGCGEPLQKSLDTW